MKNQKKKSLNSNIFQDFIHVEILENECIIDYETNYIDDFPASSILTLDFSNFQIFDLPKNLELMVNLKNLIIDGSKIKVSDLDIISMLPNLLFFSAKNCELTDSPIFPESIETIDLSNNKITNINGFYHLPNLKNVYLSYNSISSCINSFNDNLERLHLNNNQLIQIKIQINSLKELLINDNNLKILPAIPISENLIVFDCSFNNLTSFNNILSFSSNFNYKCKFFSSIGNKYEQKFENIFKENYFFFVKDIIFSKENHLDFQDDNYFSVNSFKKFTSKDFYYDSHYDFS